MGLAACHTDVCHLDALELDEIHRDLAVLTALEDHLWVLVVLAHLACHRCTAQVSGRAACFFERCRACDSGRPSSEWKDAPWFFDFLSTESCSKSAQIFTPSVKSSDVKKEHGSIKTAE